ncbi:hypothetical protein JMN32_01810 [Fulvivirga sp. 29W222]|uniref:Uncharacterized protein n=1 Tax=Fulvivirga marina TaxID=2494733 RepID=A0A937KCJ2_9BACT|nr:hypothetical protein [Fulvivirga marina]MBL6445025.1 hypothetical protein [Fulvivirga marina]
MHPTRIFKYKDYLWKPEKRGIKLNTTDGGCFTHFDPFDEREYKDYLKDELAKEEKIHCISAFINTEINPRINYDFDKAFSELDGIGQ